ncbi:MAG TPA: YtxH domain-containing protein [Bryobacteraceae bacterium]|nr:YtxH domain-containing protein [Bryobacteraceae bacterium]
MARNNGDTLVWFLVGAAVGASVALLYAPQSGDRTRRLLGRKFADSRDALSEQGSELLEKSRDLFEKGRKVADDAAELFEKGRSMVKG